MSEEPKMPEPQYCECPIYCKYCGAKLRRDVVGHYCPTKNCQWEHGVKGCLIVTRLAQKCFDRLASRADVWATHGRPGTIKEIAIIEEIAAALAAALALAGLQEGPQ